MRYHQNLTLFLFSLDIALQKKLIEHINDLSVKWTKLAQLNNPDLLIIGITTELAETFAAQIDLFFMGTSWLILIDYQSSGYLICSNEKLPDISFSYFKDSEGEKVVKIAVPIGGIDKFKKGSRLFVIAEHIKEILKKLSKD